MADSRFSSKPSSSRMMRSMMGSLGLRVFIVCLVLLVLPLLFHAFFIYDQEYRLRMRDLLQTLQMIGEGKAEEVDQRLQMQLENLSAFTLVVGLEKEAASLPSSSLLQQIVKKEEISSLFYLGLGPDQDLICLVSSNEEMQGKPPPFLPQFQSALKRGQGIFLADDAGVHPNRAVKQVYIARTVYSERDRHPLGLLVLSFPAQGWMERVSQEKGLPYAFSLFLLSSDDEICWTNSSTPLEAIKIFTEEKIKMGKTIPFFDLFKGNRRSLGVQITLEKSPFNLLVELPKKEIFKVPTHHVLFHLTTLFFLILIVGGGGTFLITRRMARPLKSLASLMQRVEGGDLSARYKRDLMGFEINLLGANFNRMIEALLTHMKEAKNEKLGRELLANELKIGYDIQTSLLPHEIPEFPGLDIAAGFLSAQEVAGDFYDLFVKKEKQNDQLMIAIADASGKGISACLYSLCVRSMLRSYDASYSDLSEVIRLTNNLFCLDTGDTGIFVTAWIGQYVAETHMLHYSSCGHLPAIVRRKNGSLEELSTPGMALGVLPFDKVALASIQLFPGDQLILYTDGILEAQDAQKHLFGKERFFDLLRSGQEETAQALVDRIVKEVALFSKGVPQHDDLTILVIRIL